MVMVIASATIVAALFGFLALTVARALEESGDLPETLAPMVARLRPLKVWHFLGLVALAVVLASPEQAVAALIVLGMALVVVWYREFLCLMGRRDDEFPGRFDKPLWALAMIVTGPLGALAFRSYRAAHWPAAVADETDPRREANPSASVDPLI